VVGHYGWLKIRKASTSFDAEVEAWLGANRLAALLIDVLVQKIAQMLRLGSACWD